MIDCNGWLDDSGIIVHAFWCWCALIGVGNEMTVVATRIIFRAPYRWMLTHSLH